MTMAVLLSGESEMNQNVGKGTWTDADNSIFAFSAASLSLWRAMLSLDKSTPL